MPKITRVAKCRKSPGECGKCGKEIEKGQPYLHWSPGFRGVKRVRCTSPGCGPRPSDLTANDKLSRVYAAQENCQDVLGGATELDEVRSTLESAAEEIREVAQEYQESADSIRDSFSESPTADECEEKANELESWADEIEGAADSVGEIECSYCTQGADDRDRECELCEGTGVHEIDCSSCNGEEVEDEDDECPECDGDGTVDTECSECCGEGTIECEEHDEKIREALAEALGEISGVVDECPV